MAISVLTAAMLKLTPWVPREANERSECRGVLRSERCSKKCFIPTKGKDYNSGDNQAVQREWNPY